MKVLKSLADRFAPPMYRHPASPVPAANTMPSMILSADDDGGPSRRLLELGVGAAREAAERVRLGDLLGRPHVPQYFDSWPGEHYRLLGGLMRALRPAVAVEMGTGAGLSALAMLRFLSRDSRLVSFDLRRWDTLADTALTPDDFADGRLSQEIANLSTPESIARHRGLLQSAQFIFIDAACDGRTERAILDGLRSLAFAQPPILMFDDIRLWPMLRFWREINLPKLDLTTFGHWSGTGLVELAERSGP